MSDHWIVPVGAESITDDSLSDDRRLNLTSVSMPSNSVTAIGGYALARCPRLSSVSLSSSLTYIGRGAFEGSSIVTLSLPPLLAFLGDECFHSNAELRSVRFEQEPAAAAAAAPAAPSKSIGKYCFSQCVALQSFSFPPSVTIVSAGVLEGCDSLSSVDFGPSVTSIGDHAFSGDIALRSVSFPPTLERVGNGALDSCLSLTHVDIPQSVLSVGHGLFASCTGLRSVSLPSHLRSVPPFLFDACSSLQDPAPIPPLSTSIGSSAFRGCHSLVSVSVPPFVTSINSYAFSHCSRLTDLSLPPSVTSLGPNSFAHCASLRRVTADSRKRLVVRTFAAAAAADLNGLSLECVGDAIREKELELPLLMRDLWWYAEDVCRYVIADFFEDEEIVIAKDAFAGCPADVDYVMARRVVRPPATEEEED